MSPREGVRVNPIAESWAADPRVAGILRHYRWMRVQNHRYIVYLGEGAVSHRMVITLDQYASEQPSITVRRIGRLDSIMGRLWR
jgi:hypothetical protein